MFKLAVVLAVAVAFVLLLTYAYDEDNRPLHTVVTTQH